MMILTYFVSDGSLIFCPFIVMYVSDVTYNVNKQQSSVRLQLETNPKVVIFFTKTKSDPFVDESGRLLGRGFSRVTVPGRVHKSLCPSKKQHFFCIPNLIS